MAIDKRDKSVAETCQAFTQEWLNVWGSKGSIFALGDASTVQQDGWEHS